MKAQVVATRYPQIVDGDRYRRNQGEIIEVEKEEFERGVELGVLRKPDDSDLPEPNAAATAAEGTAPALTQPDGTEITNAETEPGPDDFRKAGSHREADAMAQELGVTFPPKTRLDDKNEALAAVAAARDAAGPALTPTGEDISELSDKELIQRGIDYGHDEEEMIELGHDELVLFVSEAMGRQGNTPEAQERSVDERTEPVQAPAPPE